MFKQAFKHYKTKWPTPNLDGVVDFDCLASETAVEAKPAECNLGCIAGFVQPLEIGDINTDLELPVGLQPAHLWRCYTLSTHPGLVIIRNPFTVRGQRYWIARCLRDYPRAPHHVNLHANLFTPAAIADWWSELQQCTDKNEARRLKISMRWATLGYHHNWDTKLYDEARHTRFPADLSQLSEYFAAVLGFANFQAQAAIINYYPIGTTLSGHTDHSELNHEAPLFSYSFGQTAVFLIGGPTREEQPTALYLRSGDVLMMSQQSRLCYHAVPRVMKARTEPWNELLIADRASDSQPLKKLRRDFVTHSDSSGSPCWNLALYQQVCDEHFWLPYQQYLNDSRINMNVRQVLPAGVTQLPSH